MSNRTPYKDSLQEDSLVPASRTATATGHHIDTRGWMWLRVKMHLGAQTGDETVVLSLEDSADASSFAAISGGPTFPTTGTYATGGVDGDQPKELMIFLPTAEFRRYVRPVVTHTGTGTFSYSVSLEVVNPVTSDLATQTPSALVAS